MVVSMAHDHKACGSIPTPSITHKVNKGSPGNRFLRTLQYSLLCDPCGELFFVRRLPPFSQLYSPHGILNKKTKENAAQAFSMRNEGVYNGSSI